MHIKRELITKVRSLAKQFPVISIFGPRQSGKTTLSQAAFKNYKYVNLEDLSTKKFAKKDPKGFLEVLSKEKGVILDEVQNVPDLLSYIQIHVDTYEKSGFFILTGSQNLLLNEKVSQSLAGRVAILTLLPFSVKELKKEKLLPSDWMEVVFEGFYPRVVAGKSRAEEWYENYIRTYLERDVRQVKNIVNLSLFEDFLKLCAGRIGQLLNTTSLANDCGITVDTARSWLSILEASYVIYLLRPHHKNFRKRIVKSPKLYFYDTGIACSLLGVERQEELLSHYLRGGLFECFILSELAKNEFNRGKRPRMYFWRDNKGNEVDCVIEKKGRLIPVEIKSGKTINESFFDTLKYWNEISETSSKDNFVIYGGNEDEKRTHANVLGWKSLEKVTRK